jgi:hypothetical protein
VLYAAARNLRRELEPPARRSTAIQATFAHAAAVGVHRGGIYKGNTPVQAQPAGAKALAPIVATKSTADFDCHTSNAAKPEGMCTSRRKIYYSTAHVWTTIVYPDDDRPAVANVCYPNFCSERECSMCGR